jgi:hypothetical protein
MYASLLKKITDCKALEARNDTLAAEEARRVAQVAEAQAHRDVLEAYRRVLKTSEGIADRLLIQARGALEGAINQTLKETMVPFRVSLDADFKLKIGTTGGKLTPPSSKAASGCQKFVVSLASRHALWHLAEVALLDCLIVDEGFSVCDDAHLEQVAQYLETAVSLATAPRLHFVVSHLDALKNRLERPLAIERRGGLSYVANTAPLESVKPKPRPRPTPAPPAALKPLAAVLPPDPDAPGKVWCAVCEKSLAAARGPRHLETAEHAKAVKRMAKRNAGVA